jgi:hypothetical protein
VSSVFDLEFLLLQFRNRMTKNSVEKSILEDNSVMHINYKIPIWKSDYYNKDSSYTGSLTRLREGAGEGLQDLTVAVGEGPQDHPGL